jgi:hypothetical protein
MRILSHDEGYKWAQSLEGSEATATNPRYSRSFRLDPDSGRKTELARLLATGVAESKGAGVLWIGEIGIWPSSENLELFNGYRRSLGEARPLHEAPIHEFGAGDYVALECLLDLVLYFVWDASLIDVSDATAFHISHDEWITVRADGPEPVERWSQAFADIGLKPLP